MMVTDPDCLDTDYDPIKLEDVRNFEPILEHKLFNLSCVS